MGLDTTHDCWHGPYSSFGRWRNMIGVAAGYELADHEYPAIGGKPCIIKTVKTPPNLTEQNFLGHWDTPPDDPLLVLFAHSDCEGVIRCHDAARLADALDKLSPKLLNDQWPLTKRFIDGLLKAAEAGEDVEFN